jgi:hypothetical protein
MIWAEETTVALLQLPTLDLRPLQKLIAATIVTEAILTVVALLQWQILVSRLPPRLTETTIEKAMIAVHLQWQTLDSLLPLPWQKKRVDTVRTVETDATIVVHLQWRTLDSLLPLPWQKKKADIVRIGEEAGSIEMMVPEAHRCLRIQDLQLQLQPIRTMWKEPIVNALTEIEMITIDAADLVVTVMTVVVVEILTTAAALGVGDSKNRKDSRPTKNPSHLLQNCSSLRLVLWKKTSSKFLPRIKRTMF